MQLILILPYILVIVAGDSIWTEEKFQYNGLTQVSVYTLPLCLQTCTYVEFCNVAMFDASAHPPCWLQTGPIELVENGTVGDSVKIYHLDRSIYEGKTCWTKHEGQTFEGLIPASYNNLYYCLIYCIAIRNCEVVSFKQDSSSSCRVHTGVLGQYKNAEFVSEPATDTYMLDKKCLLPENI